MEATESMPFCIFIIFTFELNLNSTLIIKELAQHVRAFISGTAAPPWVPFGSRQINQGKHI